MTPRQFTAFRARLKAASGFQSAQFREIEAMLGRRDRGALSAYPVGSPLHRRIAAAMSRPSLYDSYARYLATQGFNIPQGLLERDVTLPLRPSRAMQKVLLDMYRADGEPAQVSERMIDLDEGLQEWRYRHVKMVERTIGGQRGTGGSSGAAYLRSTLSRPAFPDLWAVRSEL